MSSITAPRIYAMLGNENLWETAAHCHRTLANAEIAHAVLGGVAVCLHGYRRNTVDVDVLIDRDAVESVKTSLTDAGFAWDDVQREFRSESGIPVQFLMTGDRAGRDSDVRLPDLSNPDDVTRIDDLPVVSLARLIESKIACGTGNPRRTHKDFADVVELIAVNDLSRSFARFLHKSVRKQFHELVLNARHGE